MTTSGPGLSEPTPYDYGISDNPRTTWAEARESRGPRYPGLEDLYRAQDEIIATFAAADREAGPGQAQPGPGDRTSGPEAAGTEREPRGWTRADQSYSDELMRQQKQWAAENEALWGPSEPSEWHGWSAAYGEPELEAEP